MKKNVKSSIRGDVEKIQTIESHFCRSQTKRQFIEGNKTMKDLHVEYDQECEEKQIISGNYVINSRIFNEGYNLSFFKPKKDQ